MRDPGLSETTTTTTTTMLDDDAGIVLYPNNASFNAGNEFDPNYASFDLYENPNDPVLCFNNPNILIHLH